jgi:cell division inhibitor SepF
MSVLNKLKEKLSPKYDEDFELEYEENEMNEQSNEKVASKAVKKGVATIALVQPTTYQEAKQIGDAIKTGKGIILNLQNLSNEDGVRVIDFISGIVHAVEGSVKKIATNTFICLPSTINIEGQINTENVETE